jgi:hypothetical protein
LPPHVEAAIRQHYVYVTGMDDKKFILTQEQRLTFASEFTPELDWLLSNYIHHSIEEKHFNAKFDEWCEVFGLFRQPSIPYRQAFKTELTNCLDQAKKYILGRTKITWCAFSRDINPWVDGITGSTMDHWSYDYKITRARKNVGIW